MKVAYAIFFITIGSLNAVNVSFRCLNGDVNPTICCRQVPETEDVLLRNPANCGTYFQCVHQKPLLRNCPARLHWSVAANRCEWPELAGCNSGHSTKEPTHSTTTQKSTTPDNEENDVCENDIPPPITEECHIGTTPAEVCCKGVPYWKDVLLPNPADCGSYIQCVHEKPMVRPCPSGLHWSIAANRCEWPNIANCGNDGSENGGTGNGGSENGGSGNGGSGGSGTVSDDCLRGILSAEECCKGVPYNVDILLKNPKDCRTYYQCVHEKPMIRPCPADLHWSVEANRCEWQDIANCE